MFVIYVVILILLFVALLFALYQKKCNTICTSKKRLDGKTVIVTGGTSGMGLEIATDFADRGARVIVACPFVDEGTEGRKAIVDSTGNENVIFKLLDLSSLESIRKFALDINKTVKRLDILINNAGVGAVDNSLTKDGITFIMQVNYFGQFLLTLLLLPVLRKTATSSEPTRIVNTASLFHLFGVVDFGNINNPNAYSGFLIPNAYNGIRTYANSKVCLILFAHELTKKLQGTGVVVNCVDPGLTGTRIFYCMGNVLGYILTTKAKLLSKTPWEGAQTALHVALDKMAGKVSGQLFQNCKLIKAKSSAYDNEIAKKLWQLSLEFVNLNSNEVDQLIDINKL